MKIRLILFIAAALVIFMAGCEKDNLKAPTSYITGTISYQGTPIGVASGRVSLELWQHGFANFVKQSIGVAQDGTFSFTNFDGDYKLTRLKGNGPWADNTDSIDVHVSGNTVVDVPVDPYFLIKNLTFAKSGTAPTAMITATFSIQQVNTTKTLSLAKIYLSTTNIIDNTNQLANVTKTAAAMGATALTAPQTVSVTIPTTLTGKPFLYARVGVQATGVAELIYSAPVKITLP